MLIFLNKLLWSIAIALILMVGLLFTYKLKFIQFHIKNIFQSLKKGNNKEHGISPISSLMMVLAGRIGVGSIAGIALAIYIGGSGSIFWMWIVGIIAASSTFAETVLGIKYKEQDGVHIYKGGPPYYIKNGLGKRTLGGVYAILIIISYIIGFLSIQANTIVKSLDSIINIQPIIIALIICILTSIVIFGGIQKISKVTSKLVPIMTLIYIGTAFYIIFYNIHLIPGIFKSILQGAFNFQSIIAGFIPTFIVGIQRGIFANEAGLGTGSIASSATNDTDTLKNGYIQMLGIYITTLLICTATAFIILTSDYQNLILQDINGIEITQYAFTYHLGSLGNYIVFISIILFSFSTILTGYYYGESSLKYFFQKVKTRHLFFLKLFALVILFVGSLLSATLLWNIVDIFVALLAIINMSVLFCLRNQVVEELRKKKK